MLHIFVAHSIIVHFPPPNVTPFLFRPSTLRLLPFFSPPFLYKSLNQYRFFFLLFLFFLGTFLS